MFPDISKTILKLADNLDSYLLCQYLIFSHSFEDFFDMQLSVYQTMSLTKSVDIELPVSEIKGDLVCIKYNQAKFSSLIHGLKMNFLNKLQKINVIKQHNCTLNPSLE